jgi:hypothetical protein
MVRTTGTASSSENHRARPAPDIPNITYNPGLELFFHSKVNRISICGSHMLS